MSREIKFRAWCPAAGMLTVDSVVLTGYRRQDDAHPMRAHKERGGQRSEYVGEYQLMQYTGLKDRNGVEIYEGDVIECYHGYRGAIEYNNDQEAGGRFFPAFHCEICHEKQRWYRWEVIGNIHENPALTEGRGNE